MKKYFVIASLFAISFVLISWGDKGHKAVGLIAQNHLTPQAAASIKALLGHESLADVANYADDMRNEPGMRVTAPWHYLNLPSGYTFEQFAEAVHTASKEGTVYTAILDCERTLENPEKSRTQKTYALKLLVHFVGDSHQPMHVSHVEDLGGNKTAVKFMGQGENLHGLWDYVLIDYEGLNPKQMAEKYDTATDVQIKQWQNDAVIKWLYESYVISNELYKEAEADPDFKQDYYDTHIELLHQRILKAGIRLAGVLNRIYDVPEK